jgi:hypothetical protein
MEFGTQSDVVFPLVDLAGISERVNGAMDEDGRLPLVSHLKSMVKRDGINIIEAEIVDD